MGGARKLLSVSQVKEFRRYSSDVGVFACYLFIIGLPGEGRQNVAETIRLILELDLPYGGFSVCTITPYPGTALHRQAVAKGWIERGWSEFGGYQPVMRTDGLDLDELVAARAFVDQLERLIAQRRRIGESAWTEEHRRYVRELDHWVAGAGRRLESPSNVPSTL
jgi:radical SAM superfamily enzyme YgiQ (UPF0313 family)